MKFDIENKFVYIKILGCSGFDSCLKPPNKIYLDIDNDQKSILDEIVDRTRNNGAEQLEIFTSNFISSGLYVYLDCEFRTEEELIEQIDEAYLRIGYYKCPPTFLKIPLKTVDEDMLSYLKLM